MDDSETPINVQDEDGILHFFHLQERRSRSSSRLLCRFLTALRACARTRARWGASGVCVIIFAGPRKWVSHAASLEAASLPGSPVGGVCAASGPRRFEGLFGCLPLSLPNRAAAKDQARSAATNRTGRPAQRGRTGRQQGPKAAQPKAETPTEQAARQGAGNARNDARPRGAGAQSEPPAPRVKIPHKAPARARRGKGGGAQRRAGGRGRAAARKSANLRRRDRGSGHRQAGRRAQRAPAARTQEQSTTPGTEHHAKEPGRPRRASVQAARRTATRRAAKCSPAQRVAVHNWPGAGGTAAQRAGGPRARIVTARTERGGAGGRIAFCGPLTASQIDSDGGGSMIPFPMPSERL